MRKFTLSRESFILFRERKLLARESYFNTTGRIYCELKKVKVDFPFPVILSGGKLGKCTTLKWDIGDYFTLAHSSE